LPSQDFCRDCWDASRLSRFVKTHWDLSRNINIIEKSWHHQDLLTLKMMKSLDGLRNLDKKMQKSTHFLISIETNCRETPKFSHLDEFLDLNRDFLVWTLMSRQNQEVLISTKISRLLRPTIWRRQDIDSRSRQIETPRLNGFFFSYLKKIEGLYFTVSNILSFAQNFKQLHFFDQLLKIKMWNM
jgi:hypothetical protein